LTHEDPSTPDSPARRRPPWAPLAVVVIVIALLTSLYVARNLIAREALLRWLRDHGAPAEADIHGLGLGGLTGRIVLGPAGRPDFSVETSEIAYRLTLTRSGFGMKVRSLRLVRPTLRATLKGGKLSFGALDPLVEEFRKRPPEPDARLPEILIEGGQVLLDGDLGRAELRADARLDNGELLRLDARLRPASLTFKDTAAGFGASRLTLAKRRDRLDFALDARLDSLARPGVALSGAHLRLTGQGPYPDLKKRRGDGVLVLQLTGQADAAQAGATKLEVMRLESAFTGRVAGWIDTAAVTGSGTLDGEAKTLVVSPMQARRVSLKLAANTLNWTRTGGDRVSADVRATGKADAIDEGPLRLKGLVAGAEGAIDLAKAGARADLKAALSASGSIDGMKPSKLDAAETAAVKRALRDFTVSAPGLKVALGAKGPAVDLTAPVRLHGAGGGGGVLTVPRGRSLFRDGAGAFDLKVEGGGLPKASAAVDGFRFGSGGVTAPLRLSVRSDFDMVRSGRLDAAGVLRIEGPVTRFVANRCAPFAVERLEFGDNDVTDIGGELCPGARPMFEYRDGGWQVRGAVRAAAAKAPLLQAALSNGRGGLAFGQARDVLSAAVDLTSADVADTAPQKRFNPIRITGPAILREGVWQAAIVGTDPAGRKLGEAQVTHDTRNGVGEANIDTGDLAFAPGGLQPAALSPLAVALASPAQGHAGFAGEITWSPRGLESRGVLTVRQLDFVSPAGPVHGLAGEVALTSLVPLTAAPEQRLRVAAIDAFTPVTDLQATLGIGGEAVQVQSVEAAVAGGQVRLHGLNVPFAPGSTWGGVMQLTGVQLGPLVEASPFADRVDIDARVTGRIPFQWVPQGLRIAKGELHAIQPGRLSIRREGLTGVAASQPAVSTPAGPVPEATAAAPNAFSDFAYQAMEHLAFSTLSAEIDSLPKGRLGVLFHIKGEHSPPKKQELRVGVGELLNQSFMNKPQPLPSGTKVDLTLDTSINLDQLLDDFAGYRHATGSGGVQGKGGITAPPTVEQTK